MGYAMEFDVDIRTAQRDLSLFRETFRHFRQGADGEWGLNNRE